jgi:hypothetical protein
MRPRQSQRVRRRRIQRGGTYTSYDPETKIWTTSDTCKFRPSYQPETIPYPSSEPTQELAPQADPFPYNTEKSLARNILLAKQLTGDHLARKKVELNLRRKALNAKSAERRTRKR